mmetsp:Transcript_10582/g.17765  ORF Transcript_10582/g.17765 Transcript_10582/m.17765 type:complete len:110 (-) Transcript_10582:84-413(-)
MVEHYDERGMEAVHFPIKDFNSEDLKSHLFEAAKKLHEMIDVKGQKVYVHCTAGMGRAPACVVAYLCLFKKTRNWQDAHYVDRMIKGYRKVSAPNIHAVEQVIDSYRWF